MVRLMLLLSILTCAVAKSEPTALDVDEDGTVTPLTDGLIILRQLFGFEGDSLVAGALGDNCKNCSASAISEKVRFMATNPIGASGSDSAQTGLSNIKITAANGKIMHVLRIMGIDGGIIADNELEILFYSSFDTTFGIRNLIFNLKAKDYDATYDYPVHSVGKEFMPLQPVAECGTQLAREYYVTENTRGVPALSVFDIYLWDLSPNGHDLAIETSQSDGGLYILSDEYELDSATELTSQPWDCASTHNLEAGTKLRKLVYMGQLDQMLPQPFNIEILSNE